MTSISNYVQCSVAPSLYFKYTCQTFSPDCKHKPPNVSQPLKVDVSNISQTSHVQIITLLIISIKHDPLLMILYTI